jgi:enoyl-CoA hydratase/carnithine racemase
MEPPRRLQDGSIDPKIVSGAADGDSTQIERIVRTLIPLFRRQAYDACAVRELAVDPDLIEDLVVDVVHHLIEIRDGKRWRLWRWVQNQTAPFEHWVAVVAAHKLSDLADTVLRIRNSECDLFEDVIASPVEEDDEDRGERETLLRACLLKLERHPVPSVALVRGAAFGAGFDLAAACDFRVGTPDAVLSMPPAKLGIVYSAEGLARAARLVGLARAKSLFLTARRLDGPTALECGLLDECLEAEAAEARALELCATLAAGAPLAISGMKEVFGQDEKRINHALRVLDYAERIGAAEGGDPLVIKAAAILHDIGIQEAERKHGSAAGIYQELEGPPIARRIMTELGLDDATTDHVCRIVGSHHTAGDIDTTEFRILWDADWLVNIPDVYPDATPAWLEQFIARTLRTTTGKAMAHRMYVEG